LAGTGEFRTKNCSEFPSTRGKKQDSAHSLTARLGAPAIFGSAAIRTFVDHSGRAADRSGVNAVGLVFFLFDILHLDGEDLSTLPLIEPKDTPGLPPPRHIPTLPVHFGDPPMPGEGTSKARRAPAHVVISSVSAAAPDWQT
jgi:hypothetical protein